ncbi:50S ribosomal protein L25 [Patescibacteria group bacterium]
MQLKALKREELGKKTKYLKQQNKIPAVIFGKGMESVSITLDYNEFIKVFEEAGETNIIDVVIGSETYKVLVKEYQLDPVKDTFIHISFYKPDLTIKTQAQVPVSVTGEEENELIKNGDAIALLLMQEITVEALPTDLPNEFIVDVSGLTEFGQGIAISQLKYDKEKVEIPDVDPEEFVVRLDEVIIEEEPEEEVSEEEALEGIEATEETEEGEEGEVKEESTQDEGKIKEEPTSEQPQE